MPAAELPADAERTRAQLIAENEHLRARLEEAEATLYAIRHGEVDALIVAGAEGDQVFTLTGADRIYRTLIEEMNEGALTVAQGGMILYANRRFADLVNAPLATVIGSTLRQWVAPEGQAALAALLSPHQQARRRTELTLTANSGAQIPVLLSASQLAVGSAADACSIVVSDLSEQKRTEQVIRDQLTEINQYYDTAPVGLAVLDADLRYLRVNNRLAELDGCPAADHIGRTVAEIVPTLDEQAQAVAARIRATGEPVTEIEFCGETASAPGVQRQWLEDWYPVKRTDGEIIGYSVIVNEITERRRAEQALRQSESLLRLVADNLPAFVAFVSLPEMRYQFVNRQYSASFQRPWEQIIGQPVSSLLSKENFEFALPYIERVQKGEMCSYENSFVLAEGVRWVQVNFVPSFDPDGNVDGVVILSRDITEQKRAERALAESQAMYRLLADNSSDVISMIDVDGRVAYVSPAAARRLGFTEDEMLQLDTPMILQRIHPDDRPHIAAEIKRGRELRLPTSRYEYRILSKSGDYLWMEDALTRNFDADGALVNVVVNSRNITDRKQAEAERDRLRAQLVTAQRLEVVGRLAGGIAHEFNNLLAVIMLRTEMLLRTAAPETPLHNSLNIIYATAKRSAELVRSLLGYARKQVAMPRVIDLNHAVTSSLPILQKLAGEEIRLAWQPDANLGPVRIDPSQLDQILVNLCLNARDAIAGGGAITLTASSCTMTEAVDYAGLIVDPGDYALLTVSDTGSGIAPDVLPHIFDPFFTTKAVGKGTGLGLSAVDGIVRQNGGFIQVVSQPGAGATFKIYLKSFRDAASAAAPAVAPQLPYGHGETVLLVEDEPAVLQMAAEALQFLGYTVLAAPSASAAVAAVEQHAGTIDLLLTDVIMQEMNGVELAARIAALRPGIRQLFFSGHPVDVVQQRIPLAVDARYLQKPFSLQSLATEVRAALAADDGDGHGERRSN